MIDPLAVLPQDEAGKPLPGIYHRFPHHLADQAVANGWEPVPLTDRYFCHHDDRGGLFRWSGKEPMWLPGDEG